MDKSRKAMMHIISRHKDKLSVQQYRTMIGQIKAGRGEGALVGLARMVEKEATNNNKRSLTE